MSTKGVSVTAARHLVDHICARYPIPLFVLHDFDKSGFTILRTIQCDTRRYTFAHAIEAIDLGLRLTDVEKYGLESESVEYRESARSIRATLAESGATEAEIAFLLNERVELNAFTSDELIEWIEGELKEHCVQKVIPADKVLAEGYRRQYQSGLPRAALRRVVGALPRAHQGHRDPARPARPRDPPAAGTAGIAVECRRR